MEMACSFCHRNVVKLDKRGNIKAKDNSRVKYKIIRNDVLIYFLHEDKKGNSLLVRGGRGS